MFMRPSVQYLVGAVCLSAAFWGSGCNQGVPSDFPKTFSCQIVVRDDGNPVDAASVTLIPDQLMSSIVISGSTDSYGVAMLRTLHGEYSKEGVPEGNYTVMIAKTLPIDMPTLSTEEVYSQTPQQKAAREKEYQRKRDKARVVPEQLTTPQSPLKLAVGSAGTKLEVDISEYKK